ncbi:MAG: BlaI/MecI/CopY family transcriptional regulator [Prochlorotrichaceae cyanobacterium]
MIKRSPSQPEIPTQLSLGPLEQEILGILWDHQQVSVREIQEVILQDPSRELTAASITTVLQRLAKKGWVSRHKQGGVFLWQPLVSRDRAQALQAEERFQKFLDISRNPAVVAAFADRLDSASFDQLEQLTAQIKAAREAREGGSCT